MGEEEETVKCISEAEFIQSMLQVSGEYGWNRGHAEQGGRFLFKALLKGSLRGLDDVHDTEAKEWRKLHKDKLRSNLSRVYGELMTLLEKGNSDFQIKAAYVIAKQLESLGAK